MSKYPKLFKTTVAGVGPFCVEFEDGEIITTRTEDRQRQIADAARSDQLIQDGLDILMNAVAGDEFTASIINALPDKSKKVAPKSPFCDRPGFITELQAIMGKYAVECIDGPARIFLTGDLGTPLILSFDQITPTEIK